MAREKHDAMRSGGGTDPIKATVSKSRAGQEVVSGADTPHAHQVHKGHQNVTHGNKMMHSRHSS